MFFLWEATSGGNAGALNEGYFYSRFVYASLFHWGMEVSGHSLNGEGQKFSSVGSRAVEWWLQSHLRKMLLCSFGSSWCLLLYLTEIHTLFLTFQNTCASLWFITIIKSVLKNIRVPSKKPAVISACIKWKSIFSWIMVWYEVPSSSSLPITRHYSVLQINAFHGECL